MQNIIKLFKEVSAELDRVIEEDKQNEMKLDNLILLKKLKKLGVTKINLTSLGNSIAAGYSQHRLVKPLLERNESLDETAKYVGIELNKYNVARAQNNNDNRIFNYVLNNTTCREIHNMNVSDYSNYKRCKMGNDGKVELNEKISSKGIQDIIKETDPSLANIVVYHGCTGSFLDNCTRSRETVHGILSSFGGIRKDHESLAGLLNYVQNQNRTLGTNTQIYLGGAPDILGIKITNVMNLNIKKKAKLYANTSYVKPIFCKFFYNTGVDFNHSEDEYKKLNKKIIKTIDQNYIFNMALIDIDRLFYRLSETIELYTNKLEDNSKYINDSVNEKLDYWFNFLKENQCDLKSFKKRLLCYFRENAPYDFDYLDKNYTIEKIKTYK